MSEPEAQVRLTLHSPTPFPIRDAMPQLHIHDRVFSLGGHTDADLTTMEFSIDRRQLEALPEGAPVVLRYDADGEEGPCWHFGPFGRKRLRMTVRP